MNSIVAWLVICPRGDHAAFIDETAARLYSAKQHGMLEPLIKESDVSLMLGAAFEAGAMSKLRKEQHDA